jgi:TolB-like protein
VPAALTDLVLRLLEKSPDARVQSSADLIAALERIQTSAEPERAYIRLLHRWQRTRRARRQPARRARMAWFTTAIVVMAIAAVALATFWRRTPAGEAPPPTDVTLAVMPFESIPATKDTTLADGLADAFISRLGQLPGVRVLPLTATGRLRGQDPLEAARQLGATRVLTVRLQREGGAIRATPQLLSAKDGQVIWTTMVPTEESQIFTIQDTIVKQVLEQLAPQLSANASTRITAVGTRNNDAYEKCSRPRDRLESTAANLTQAANSSGRL